MQPCNSRVQATEAAAVDAADAAAPPQLWLVVAGGVGAEGRGLRDPV